jgi:hypothetical protein
MGDAGRLGPDTRLGEELTDAREGVSWALCGQLLQRESGIQGTLAFRRGQASIRPDVRSATHHADGRTA